MRVKNPILSFTCRGGGQEAWRVCDLRKQWMTGVTSAAQTVAWLMSDTNRHENVIAVTQQRQTETDATFMMITSLAGRSYKFNLEGLCLFVWSVSEQYKYSWVWSGWFSHCSPLPAFYFIAGTSYMFGLRPSVLFSLSLSHTITPTLSQSRSPRLSNYCCLPVLCFQVRDRDR